jgi:hypothetical protein
VTLSRGFSSSWSVLGPACLKVLDSFPYGPAAPLHHQGTWWKLAVNKSAPWPLGQDSSRSSSTSYSSHPSDSPSPESQLSTI